MISIVLPYDTGRIAILADTHWDSYGMAGVDPIQAHSLDPLLEAGVDAVIIAGDLANGPVDAWRNAAIALKRRLGDIRVFVLPGNHDYYMRRIDADPELEKSAAKAGMKFAQKREIRHGKTRILCCTLWTDFALSGDAPLSQVIARRVMRDYDLIQSAESREGRRFAVSPAEILAVHEDHRQWLEDALGRPHFAGDEGRTVVVTHHGPHPSAAGRMDGLTPAFHSDLEDMILDHQPDAWFFGHSHRRLRAQVGGTDIRNVSLGYPGESQVPGSVPLSEVCLWEGD